jgi:hypothetical protein
MAQKTTRQQRFIAERVHALAVVYLTRREDLIVSDDTTDSGVELCVTLNPDDKPGQRKFGVKLQGIRTAITSGRPDENLFPTMQRMRRYGPFPFPVVVFFFTMENSEGWYTWAAEPVVSAAGDFEIVQHSEASCRPLNSRAVDEIVEAVDRWFDAFFAKATREMPTKKRHKSSDN